MTNVRMNNEDFEVARLGVVVINDTTIYNLKNARGISVLEDTIIASLKINNNAINVIANYVTTPANIIPKGTLITAQNGAYFSEILLTSGSVSFILDNV